MNVDVSIPPLRDLPSGRLAQRREHLLFEITRERESRGVLAHPWPSRWRRHGRRRLLVLAAAVLVVVMGTASALAVRAYIVDKGFIGLPPQGATPSTPESGELEIFYWIGDPEGNLGRSRAWVYTDGRLLWLRGGADLNLIAGANRFSSGFLEQRLTPEGVELLRSEILSAGEFGLEPLHDPFPCPEGESLVRYSCATPEAPLGSEPLQVPYWVTIDVHNVGHLVSVDRASDLERLEARLTDPVSWLPASAWADRETRAYVPSRFAVCYGTSPPTRATEPSRILSLLPAAAADMLRGEDRTPFHGSYLAAPGDIRPLTDYCSDMTIDEARPLARALEDAGPTKKADPDGTWRTDYVQLNYEFEGSAEGLEGVFVSFEPYLPHGETICSPCG
jgi:hypothetical protein